MSRTKFTEGQIRDEDLITNDEIGAGHKTTEVGPSGTWPVSTTGADTGNNIINVSNTDLTQAGIEPGDTVSLVGGPNAGEYTVAGVVDATSLQVSENVSSTSGGDSLTVYHAVGSTRVGVDNSVFSNITGANLQDVLESVDVSFSLAGHTHVTGDITDFTESTQDVVGGMLNDTTYISLGYLDSNGTIAATLNTGSVPVSALNDNIGIATETYVQSRGLNLITNGTGLMGDNTNFSEFVYDPSEAYSAPASFRVESTENLFLSTDEVIAVDASKHYRLSAYVKGGSSPSKFYIGVSLQDADGRGIQAYNWTRYPGTDTRLAQPLTPGDTVVYLDDASNWRDSNGDADHSHTITIWEYENSFGYKYPEYTYSKLQNRKAWNNGAVDTNNNTITLIDPWPSSLANPDDPNGTWPTGTAVSNANAGGLQYIAASNETTTEDWVQYQGTIGGINYTGENTPAYYDMFPPGTAYVHPLIFANWNATGSRTTWFSNIEFGLDNPTRDDFENTSTLEWDYDATIESAIRGNVIPGALNTSELNNDAGFISGITAEQSGAFKGEVDTLNFINGTHLAPAISLVGDEIRVRHNVDPSGIGTSELNNDAGFVDINHTHSTGDITAFPDAAKDAAGDALSDTSTIDFSYDNVNKVITADVIPGALNTSELNNDEGFITGIGAYENGVTVGGGSIFNFIGGNNTTVNVTDQGVIVDIEISSTDTTLSGSAAGGDLGGTYPNPTVTGLTITGETNGDFLWFDGSSWTRFPEGSASQYIGVGAIGGEPQWMQINANEINNNVGWISGISNENISDLGDVTISSVADNEVLAYNSGTGDWINQTAAEAGLAAASHTHGTGDISGFDEAVRDTAGAAFNNSNSSTVNFAQNDTANTMWFTVNQSGIKTSLINNDANFISGVTVQNNSISQTVAGTLNFQDGTHTSSSVTAGSGVANVSFDVDPSTINTSTLNNDAGWLSGINVGASNTLTDYDSIRFLEGSNVSLSLAGISGEAQLTISASGGSSLPAGSAGDILTHDGANWVTLAPGLSGQVLHTDGSSSVYWSTDDTGSPAHTHNHDIGHFEAYNDAPQQITGGPYLLTDTVRTSTGIFTLNDGLFTSNISGFVAIDMQASFVNLQDLSKFRAFLIHNDSYIAGTYIYETLGDPAGDLAADSFCSITWKRTVVNVQPDDELGAVVEILDYDGVETVAQSVSVCITPLYTDTVTP